MFRQDFSCPALIENINASYPYGAITTTACLSRQFWLQRRYYWPGPRSLATTNGVSVDVLSSRY